MQVTVTAWSFLPWLITLIAVLAGFHDHEMIRSITPHSLSRRIYTLNQHLRPVVSQLPTTSRLSPINRNHFSTSRPTMAEKKTFFEAVAERKTVYALSNESPISDARIHEIVDAAIHESPSAFNSQTTRAVVVLGKKHEELWDAVAAVYKSFLPEDKFAHLKQRFDGHRAGYGTVGLLTGPTHFDDTHG